MSGIEPLMGIQSYKTYAILTPRSTHFRPATCEEVECEAYTRGWTTTLDVSTALGQKQYNYVRLHSGRVYHEVTSFGDLNKGHVVLMFPPGQKCFAEHKVRLEREPLFIVRAGDRRGNPTGFKRVHRRAIDWRDDFGEHQEKLAEEQKKG